MKWLCDTNILSEVFKKTPEQKVIDWLSALDEVYLSVVTIEEIICGLTHLQTAKKIKWFEKFIKFRGRVLSVTEEIARQCGVLRGQFLRNGLTRTQADLFIAATAIEHNLALATRNERDFSNCGIPIFNPFT